MHMKWTMALCGLVVAALIPPAHAQGTAQTQAPAQTEVSIRNQIDIAGSFFEALTTKSISGSGITQTSSNGIGGMFEARRIQSPWIGYEFTYSLSPDNQTITPIAGACQFSCNLPQQPLKVKHHEFTLDYVASRKYGSLRPFLVGGFGFSIFVPSGIQGTYLENATKPSIVGGGGVDIGVGSRLGVRVQYREDLFTAPHLDPVYPATRGYTPAGEPLVGIFFHL